MNAWTCPNNTRRYQSCLCHALPRGCGIIASMPSNEFLDHSYAQYSLIEEAFQAELDKSLDPRGPDLRPWLASAGRGLRRSRYALELARRFGLSVHGIDPIGAHIDICN